MREKDYSPASSYLARVYGESTEHAVELRSVPNEHGTGRTASLFTRDPADIELYCARWDAPGRAVYYGEATRLVGRSSGRREDLAELVSLWTDTDCSKLGLEKDVVATAMKTGMHLPPSLIIDSGYGIHARWLFTEKLDISAGRPGATALEAELVAALRGLAGLVAGDLAVCDLARVMRLPGTHNTKGGDMVPCRILEASWARYEWRDLQEMLDWHRPVVALPEQAHRVPADNPFTEFARRFATKAPIDVQHRLEAMTYLGMGETAIHQTQLQVSASLVRGGVDDDAVVALVLDATHRAAGLAGERWNWLREEANLRRMIADWRRKQGRDSQPAAVRPVAPVIQLRPQQQDPQPDKKPPADDAPSLAGFPLNDLGNAMRLITQHGTALRYVVGIGWHVWDGRRYAADPAVVAARRLAHETARTMLLQSFDQPMLSPQQSKRRDSLIKFSITSGNSTKTSSMLSQAEPHLSLKADDLNANIWLLNCRNGTVEVQTGKVRAHAQSDLITKLVDVDYDPAARCPAWERFLLEIFAHDQDMISFVQRALGYSLSGSTREQVLFIMHGGGANGKSVFLEVIAALLGDYASHCPSETFTSRDIQGAAIPNDIARLNGARFVSIVETEHNRKLAEGLVKQATGGDRLTARFMRQEFFEFTPQFKLWLATNHKPRVSGTDNAIWRRIRLLPFNVTFVDRDVARDGDLVKDPDLKSKLLDELPGILRWLVEGCAAWIGEGGLKPPVVVTEATKEYRESQDVVSGFIEECCDVDPGIECNSGELFDRYKKWCAANGEKSTTSGEFGMALTEKGFFPRKGAQGVRRRKGLDLKPVFDGEATQ